MLGLVPVLVVIMEDGHTDRIAVSSSWISFSLLTSTRRLKDVSRYLFATRSILWITNGIISVTMWTSFLEERKVVITFLIIR
ncbi:MAG: hypothetical protein WBP64_13825 [Nitrososphaeraceae archaeon]